MPNAKKSKTNSTTEQLKRRREERKAGRGNSEPADWATVDSETIAELVEAFTRSGGVIGFGYTRDGGAYYISYFIDGERDNVYIRPTEDVDKRLVDEIQYWNGST